MLHVQKDDEPDRKSKRQIPAHRKRAISSFTKKVLKKRPKPLPKKKKK